MSIVIVQLVILFVSEERGCQGKSKEAWGLIYILFVLWKLWGWESELGMEKDKKQKYISDTFPDITLGVTQFFFCFFPLVCREDLILAVSVSIPCPPTKRK